MLELRILGNDLELDREKIARLFDIRATLLDELNEAIDRANTDPSDIRKIRKNILNLLKSSFKISKIILVIL